MNNKKAFTMIELVFVIVVLGILAGVALPRLAVSRGDAQVTTGRADVATIRSAIITERQQRLFRGNPAFIATLNPVGSATIFGGLPAAVPDPQILLQYPLTPAAVQTNGSWTTAGDGINYAYSFGNSNVLPGGGVANFVYVPATGVFDCGATAACAALTD